MVQHSPQILAREEKATVILHIYERHNLVGGSEEWSVRGLGEGRRGLSQYSRQLKSHYSGAARPSIPTHSIVILPRKANQCGETLDHCWLPSREDPALLPRVL